MDGRCRNLAGISAHRFIPTRSWFSKIVLMKGTTFSLIWCVRVRPETWDERALVGRLFRSFSTGRSWLSGHSGRYGAIKFYVSYLYTSVSIVFRKAVSPMDWASLLSFSVLLSTLCPRLCTVGLESVGNTITHRFRSAAWIFHMRCGRRGIHSPTHLVCLLVYIS